MRRGASTIVNRAKPSTMSAPPTIANHCATSPTPVKASDPELALTTGAGSTTVGGSVVPECDAPVAGAVPWFEEEYGAALVVGASVVGASLVGASVVGAASAGTSVVGAAVVGVGTAVVGGPTPIPPW